MKDLQNVPPSADISSAKRVEKSPKSESCGRDNTTKVKQNDKLGKELSMLKRFAEGAKLHRFQAEPLGDHCLHTTVSDLQINCGIKFSRHRVSVRNRFGGRTSVCEYWLEGDDLSKARKILGMEVAL